MFKQDNKRQIPGNQKLKIQESDQIQKIKACQGFIDIRQRILREQDAEKDLLYYNLK